MLGKLSAGTRSSTAPPSVATRPSRTPARTSKASRPPCVPRRPELRPPPRRARQWRQRRRPSTSDARSSLLSLDTTSLGRVDLLVKATIAAHVLIERTHFAIDDAGDEDNEDEEEDGEAEYDDDVLDEVRLQLLFFAGTRTNRSHAWGCVFLQVDAFIEAHGTGVTDADNEVANGP